MNRIRPGAPEVVDEERVIGFVWAQRARQLGTFYQIFFDKISQQLEDVLLDRGGRSLVFPGEHGGDLSDPVLAIAQGPHPPADFVQAIILALVQTEQDDRASGFLVEDALVAPGLAA